MYLSSPCNQINSYLMLSFNFFRHQWHQKMTSRYSVTSLKFAKINSYWWWVSTFIRYTNDIIKMTSRYSVTSLKFASTDSLSCCFVWWKECDTYRTSNSEDTSFRLAIWHLFSHFDWLFIVATRIQNIVVFLTQTNPRCRCLWRHHCHDWTKEKAIFVTIWKSIDGKILYTIRWNS